MRRTASSSRLHDFGPLTVAICSNFFCDGSHRWPKIDVIFRDKWLIKQNETRSYIRYRRISLPLPCLSPNVAYRLRRVGGERVRRTLVNAYYRAWPR